MIIPNEEKSAEIFNDLDLLKCFYALLNTVGGKMTIQKSLLKSTPDSCLKKMTVEDLPDMGLIRITIKKKRERDIIKPNRKLFLPDSP